MRNFILTAAACLPLLLQAQTPPMHLGTNTPIGEGKGIHPGRVAWIHNPGTSNWDGETGYWFEDRWNDQARADRLIAEAVMTLTGEQTQKAAWDALFVHFNTTHGRGERGYVKGEKIAVKLNINNSFDYQDNEQLNASPQLALSLLRSMVNEAGIDQKDITLCEPSRYMTDALYNKCHSEFPDIVFVDNVGGPGRIKAEYYPNALPYSTDKGESATGIAKCIVDADYLIDDALLKIHTGPGVTLTAKNWYGVTSIDKNWRNNTHNSINQNKSAKVAAYSSFVDFIGHKDIGQKCMLYLIDGTYGSRDVNGKPFPKWEKAPFNGDWACSVLASQDPLAIDAVGLDLLVGEWPEVGSLPYCDMYLVEAASLPNAPSGTKYDPERDGTVLDKPLGLMEHWNNVTDKKYEKLELLYMRIY